MKTLTMTFAAVTATALASNAQAAFIKAGWNMAGLTGTESSVAGVGVGVTTLNATRGAGLNGSSAANSMSASGWTGQSTDYFSFGFTVASGDVVNLTSLSIGTRASGTGPGTVGLFFSGDNFTTALGTITQGSGTNVYSVINLTALQGLTGTIEFRLMAIGTNSAGGGTTASGGTLRMTNYVGGSPAVDQGGFFLLGESVPVPAPGAMALLGVAGLAVRARRR